MTSHDYSAQALLGFLDYLQEKGLLKQNTASSRKAAVGKILSILDETERKDLRKINAEDVFRRFSNLEGGAYKPDSLLVYSSRFRTALMEFLTYVENNKVYKPKTVQRTSKNGAGKDKVTSGGRHEEKGAVPKPHSNDFVNRRDALEGDELIVPVPLRADLTVHISNLPANLTMAEAEKLAAIVKAYASE